ncbi:MAG: hypothetical protein ABIE43_00505 [Patescibacteria group bacterium]
MFTKLRFVIQSLIKKYAFRKLLFNMGYIYLLKHESESTHKLIDNQSVKPKVEDCVRPDILYRDLLNESVGISNKDLNKIPIEFDYLYGADVDGDNLPDLFEDAIGTDKNSIDTDSDGYDDKVELESGYDPINQYPIKLPIDKDFSNNQKGKVFLQIENSGEAWYISQKDGKRYFLGDAVNALEVLRRLKFEISDACLY